MGVERHADDGLLFLATAMMKTPEQEAAVYPKVKVWIDEVRAYADTMDGNLEWTCEWHLSLAIEMQHSLCECDDFTNLLSQISIMPILVKMY